MAHAEREGAQLHEQRVRDTSLMARDVNNDTNNSMSTERHFDSWESKRGGCSSVVTATARACIRDREALLDACRGKEDIWERCSISRVHYSQSGVGSRGAPVSRSSTSSVPYLVLHECRFHQTPIIPLGYRMVALVSTDQMEPAPTISTTT